MQEWNCSFCTLLYAEGVKLFSLHASVCRRSKIVLSAHFCMQKEWNCSLCSLLYAKGVKLFSLLASVCKRSEIVLSACFCTQKEWNCFLCILLYAEASKSVLTVITTCRKWSVLQVVYTALCERSLRETSFPPFFQCEQKKACVQINLHIYNNKKKKYLLLCKGVCQCYRIYRGEEEKCFWTSRAKLCGKMV